jgi:5-methylcytosine-specific restriction protein A
MVAVCELIRELKMKKRGNNMTSRAKKPCSKHGCGGLVDPPTRYCDAHKAYGAAKQTTADRARGTTTQRGYGADWVAMQALAMRRDNYTCQHCLKRGIVKTADIVHHIIAIEVDQALRLEFSNLVSICHSCHAVENARRHNDPVPPMPTPPKKSGVGFF